MFARGERTGASCSGALAISGAIGFIDPLVEIQKGAPLVSQAPSLTISAIALISGGGGLSTIRRNQKVSEEVEKILAQAASLVGFGNCHRSTEKYLNNK